MLEGHSHTGKWLLLKNNVEVRTSGDGNFDIVFVMMYYLNILKQDCIHALLVLENKKEREK